MKRYNFNIIANFIIFCMLTISVSSYSQEGFCYQNLSLTKIDRGQDDQERNTLPLDDQLLLVRIVVHQVYHDENSFLETEKIELLVDQLNDLYSATDIDTLAVHSSHRDIIQNTNIRFCLATIDPDGNPTSGITNTKTDTTQFHMEDINGCLTQRWKDSEQGGHSPWPDDKYVNIWIMDNVYDLSFATPYPNNWPLSDYVICDDPLLGVDLDISWFESDDDSTIGTAANVLAHEIGHVFGLLHTLGPYGIFSGLDECAYDDFMDDTPTCNTGSICGVFFDSCDDDGVDNATNIMAWGCVLMFTPDQSKQMRSNLQTNMADVLISGASCADITSTYNITSQLQYGIFPNPSNGQCTIQTDYDGIRGAELKIFNTLGDCILKRNIESESTSVNIENQKGLFIVVISMDGINYTKKMIIQ